MLLLPVCSYVQWSGNIHFVSQHSSILGSSGWIKNQYLRFKVVGAEQELDPKQKSHSF